MEKHYLHPTGLAAALTGAIIYTLCSLAVWLWPAQSISFFSRWFHGIDLTKIAVTPQITVSGFVLGLIGVIIVLYLVGLIYAWFYNKCVQHCKKRKWI